MDALRIGSRQNSTVERFDIVVLSKAVGTHILFVFIIAISTYTHLHVIATDCRIHYPVQGYHH